MPIATSRIGIAALALALIFIGVLQRSAHAERPGGPPLTMAGFSLSDVVSVALLGLATTSSVMLGAVLGLYIPFPKKVLAGILAFAAGSLIAALAIEFGFEGAHELVRQGANVRDAWVSIAGGFAVGAVIYYVALLSKCGLLRHLSAEAIEPLLDRVQEREVRAGEIVFRTGDPGDALYIVAHGVVEVL